MDSWMKVICLDLTSDFVQAQAGPQALDLIAQLSDQFDIGILIDCGFVDNILGSVGVSQGTKRFSMVHFSRTNGSDHDSLGISPQRILEQPGQN